MSLSHSFRLSSSLVLLASFDFLSLSVSLFSGTTIICSACLLPRLSLPRMLRETHPRFPSTICSTDCRGPVQYYVFVCSSESNCENPRNNVIEPHVISPYLNDVYTEMDDAFYQDYTGNHLFHFSHISEKFTKNLWGNGSSLKGDIIFEKGQI